jgi:hypothetical protein
MSKVDARHPSASSLKLRSLAFTCSIERMIEPTFASLANNEVSRTCISADPNGDVSAAIMRFAPGCKPSFASSSVIP